MMITLTVVCVFATIILAIVGVQSYVTPETTAVDRLRAMVPVTGPKTSKNYDENVIAQIVGVFGHLGFGGGDGSHAGRLSAAGMRRRNAMTVFLGARTLLSFGPAMMIVVPRIISGKPLGQTLWYAIGAWAFGHFGTNYWLRRQAQKRINQITRALPDSLDLMVVCLEAGLGLNSTIARVAEERAPLKDPLGQEFSQVAFELRSGRSREEALRSVGLRNGVDDLKSLAAIMVQSDKLGASMGNSLRVHADLVRTRRRQRAEEAARKLPIKILLPLATCLLPALFVLVLGPAFLGIQNLMKVILRGPG